MEMTRTNMVEAATGGVVLLVAAGFLLFALQSQRSGSASGGGGYRVLAEFDNVEGVFVGTDVRLAGIKIGSVVGQELDKSSFQAKLVMQIDKTVPLSDDTTAKITSEGLLGGKFVSLDPGGSDTILGDGGLISYTQGAVDIWSLISQAMFDKSSSVKKTDETGAPPTEQ